jgi:spore coat polysaccharide biosynthesis protein SpsF (cytidylyltransferase family)
MNPKVVLILQARMGSTRLPGKSMMDLAGAPLVGRMLERVKYCNKVHQIILAVPDTLENVQLQRLGKSYGVTVFAGSENNLVDRYFNAAMDVAADVVVRLPADNATPQWDEIDRIIDHHISLGRPGFSSNICNFWGSGYPDGIGAEVFDFCLLQDVANKKLSSHNKEHVHTNFFNYELGEPVDSDWCPVSTIKCPESFRRPDLILDINTQEQYLFMKSLYEALYPRNQNFEISDIIAWYDNEFQRN